MRRLRVLVLLVLVAFGMAPALPAQAGGWAVTLLDPLPATIEPDQTYTVGYWVLQHGAHAPEGDDVGVTGLRLTGKDGPELRFEGVALPEAGHFAVAIAVPAGTWRVYAVQGWFPEFDLGTLTVPGGLELAPSKMEVNVGGHSHNGVPPTWGAVHPPGYQGKGRSAATLPDKQAEQQQPEVRNTAALPEPRSPVLMALLLVGGLVVLVAGGLAIRPLRRRLRG
jgi:hypothetical protein